MPLKAKPIYWQIFILVWLIVTILTIVGVLSVSWWILFSPLILGVGYLLYTPIKVIMAGQIRKRKKK